MQSLRIAAAQDAQELDIAECTQTMLSLYQSLTETTRSNQIELTVWKRLVKRWEVEINLLMGKLACLTAEK